MMGTGNLETRLSCWHVVCMVSLQPNILQLVHSCVNVAAHVRVVGCRGSVLDVVVLDCLDVVCGVCPPNGDYKIPYCTNCFDACPVGEEYILSGLHTEESLIVSNYRKGGLCTSVFEGWQRRVPPCHS